MSGCPFSGISVTRSPFAHNPPPNKSEPVLESTSSDMSVPLISQYQFLMDQYVPHKLKKFYELPVYLQNTLFHNELVTRRRNLNSTERVMFACELVDAGNREFNRGQNEKSLMCYEHALGLFLYLEKDDGELTDDTWHLITVGGDDSVDQNAIQTVLIKICVNLSLTMIKLRHYSEAKEVIQRVLAVNNRHSMARLIRGLAVVLNLKSCHYDLDVVMDDIKTGADKHPKYLWAWELAQGKIQCLYYQELAFFKEFFQCVISSIGLPLPKGTEFEHDVIRNIQQKYWNMYKYYITEPEQLSRVQQEIKPIQKIKHKMDWISSLTVNKPYAAMIDKAHNKEIDLKDSNIKTAFESAKRQMIIKSFSECNFNRRILYQCLQETLESYEKPSPKSVECEDECDYWFNWQRGMFMFLVMALIMYWFAIPKSPLLNLAKYY